MTCDVTTLAPTEAASCTVVYTTLAADVDADVAFSISVTATPTSGTLNTSSTSGSLVYTAAPTISSTLPNATFGQVYAPPLITATGGRAPYSFLASGLPSGLSLSTAGAITGSPAQAGTFTVYVQVRDSSSPAVGGPFVSAVTPLTLVVAPPALAVATSTLPDAALNVGYTAPALAASGGSSPYTYTATGLPSGLSLNPTTGVISGTPTLAGSFSVSVTATEPSLAAVGGPFISPAKAMALTVTAPTVSVTSTSLPNAAYGAPYTSPALTAAGGTAPWSFSASGLPSGLTVNPATGVIAGTSTVAGIVNVSIAATDSTPVANGGPFVSPAKSLSLTVLPPTMTVGAINSPVWTFGSFSNTGVTTVANGPLVQPFIMTAGWLPNGLVAACGTVISGTPTQAGTFSVTLQTTDSTPAAQGGPFTTPPKTLTVTVLPPTVAVTTSSLPNAAFGVAYTAPALAASGGSAPRAFAATGLPNGLTLNPSTGVISGTPAASGTFTVNVVATDATTVANGGPFASASKSLTLAATQRHATGSRTGMTTIGFIGADYVLNPAFLVGALVQFDWGQEQAFGGGSNSARGWMAGPYAATKITSNLFADARAAWGRGVSRITGTDFGEEDFESTRQLLFARLSGQWQYGAWRFSPSVSVSHYKETQQAFESKAGGLIPAQTLSLGRVSFGPEIGYTARLASGVTIEPTVGGKGIWSFLDKETSATVADPGNFTLTLEAGTQIRLPSGVVLQGGGAIEGKPNGGSSVQGQARVNVPLR